MIYMSLIEYQKKRKFSKTPEPRGKLKKSKKPIFVIQKHNASHLHWDLRLEIKGVLKSWAVPKQPPTRKGIKRLAIATEDHPLDYATFEGTIPKGHYGAGTVKIWDQGSFELIDVEGEPFRKKDKEKIEFKLSGKKLNGKYVLVKTDYGSKPEKSWLFFKI